MAVQLRRIGAVLVVLVLSACSSTQSGTPATPGVDRSAAYPEITGARTAATAQMSDAEAADNAARLSSLAGKGGAVSEAEYRRRRAEMEALRANHGRDALAGISGAN